MSVATVMKLCTSCHGGRCSETEMLHCYDREAGAHLCEWDVWPRGWARGNSVIGAPILMYFSDILASDLTCTSSLLQLLHTKFDLCQQSLDLSIASLSSPTLANSLWRLELYKCDTILSLKLFQ